MIKKLALIVSAIVAILTMLSVAKKILKPALTIGKFLYKAKMPAVKLPFKEKPLASASATTFVFNPIFIYKNFGGTPK